MHFIIRPVYNLNMGELRHRKIKPLTWNQTATWLDPESWYKMNLIYFSFRCLPRMANQNGFIKLSKRRGLLFNKNMSNTHYVPSIESCSQRTEPFHFTVTFIFTSDVTHRRIPETSLLLVLGVWHIIPFFPGVNYAVHHYSWALLVFLYSFLFQGQF